MGDVFSWSMVTALGAFHGINPGMGWLFAVALGLQERRRGAVSRRWCRLASATRWRWPRRSRWRSSPARSCRPACCAGSSARGCCSSARCDSSATGIRGGPACGGFRRLTLWSFLMATAHGAGLMVVPVFLGMVEAAPPHSVHVPQRPAQRYGLDRGYGPARSGISVGDGNHLGRRVREGRSRPAAKSVANLDVLWAAALLVTGVLTLLL